MILYDHVFNRAKVEIQVREVEVDEKPQTYKVKSSSDYLMGYRVSIKKTELDTLDGDYFVSTEKKPATMLKLILDRESLKRSSLHEDYKKQCTLCTTIAQRLQEME